MKKIILHFISLCLFITSVHAQNVGIGTTIPASKLHVSGTANNPSIPGNTSTGIFRIGPNANEGIDFGKMGAPGYAGWIQSGTNNTQADPLILQPVGGNVGIGTTTPDSTVHIVGGLKYQNGSQGSGKVLTSDANGGASWAAASGISGTGTINYIPKWTPNNTTLGNSSIKDNGAGVSIGGVLDSSTITTSANGAFLNGYMTGGSSALASGVSSFIVGNGILNATTATPSVLSATNAGAGFIGFSSGSTATASGLGSLILGTLSRNTLQVANNSGSGIWAYTTGTGNNGSKIYSSGLGSHVIGMAQNGGYIEASGLGSFIAALASTTSTDTTRIKATANGTFILGGAEDGGQMINDNNGGGIMGFLENNSKMKNLFGHGAMVFGHSSGSAGLLQTGGDGSFVFGNVINDSAYNTASGAFLVGHSISNTGTNSTIIGRGIYNTTNDVIKMGFGGTAFTINGATNNVGIGTTTPSQLLDVNGTIKTIGFQMTAGAGLNKILQSDADGVASWVNTSTPAHTIGESYGGGIVFYVYDNGQHGLIAATADQSAGMQWYNGTSRYTGTTGDGLNAGTMNTAMVVATQMADNQTGNFAAKLCADYSVTVGGMTYGDWYLPSKYELNLLYLQKTVVGGFANSSYWSSSEDANSLAWLQYFNTGLQLNDAKSLTSYVRAIRAF